MYLYIIHTYTVMHTCAYTCAHPHKHTDAHILKWSCDLSGVVHL